MVAALVVPSFFDEGSAFLPAGTLELFRSDLDLSYAQAGLVLSMVAVGSLVGSAGSVAADHFSRRILASSGAFGLATGMALFATSPWYAGLIVASLLHGLAATVLMDASTVALADAVGEEHLRPFLARGNLAGVVGDLGGPLLVGIVIGMGASWRVPFGVAAVVVALYGLLLALAPLPAPKRTDMERASPISGLVEVLSDRQVWLVGWISLLTVTFDEPFLGFLLARAEQYDVDARTYTAIAMVSVAGGLFAYGYLERRLRIVPDRWLIAGGGVLAALGSVVAAVFEGPIALATGGAVVGIGLASMWLALEHRQLTLRPRQEGTTRAVVGAIEAIGFTVPVLLGTLIDATSLAVGLAAHSVLALLIVVSALRIRRRPVGGDALAH